MVNSDEHEPPIVGKAMRRGNGGCERNAAEGLDGVGVELYVGVRSSDR